MPELLSPLRAECHPMVQSKNARKVLAPKVSQFYLHLQIDDAVRGDPPKHWRQYLQSETRSFF
ncbi:hypothetical protein [Rubritalea tangerina]|uniref:hypothetical protein n=1 Tax=Rubritalea tangerina TaxID=430798 RepID=UPI0036232AF2